MSVKWKFQNPNGLYSVSFSTVNWLSVFTRSVYKEIMIDSIRYCQDNKGLLLYCWCLMTNHMHLIVSAERDGTLPDIFRDMKKFTANNLIRAIKENPQESRKEWWIPRFRLEGEYRSSNTYYQFWQHGNHPVELWSNEAIETHVNYIHNNPVKTGVVDEPQHYLYSSARDYCGRKGLLDVILLT